MTDALQSILIAALGFALGLHSYVAECAVRLFHGELVELRERIDALERGDINEGEDA